MRKELLKGIKKLNDCVKMTLGPNGKNVLIDCGNGYPLITNDGVTVAKHFILTDKAEQNAVEIVRQAALKTNEEAGDGTTSSIVLAAEIIRRAKGIKDTIRLRDELSDAASFLVKKAGRISKRCKSKTALFDIALNSCGNPEDAAMIADAVSKCEHVNLEDNDIGERTLNFSNGFETNFEMVSSHFCEDMDKMQSIFRNPLMIIRERIDTIKPFMEEFENCIKGKRPVIIIAKSFSNEVIKALLLNKQVMRVLPLKYFNEEEAECLKEITIEKCVVRLHNALFCIKKSVNLSRYIRNLEYKTAKEKDDYKKHKLKELLGKLTTGVATISVGFATPAEQRERFLRIEDGLNAAQNAKKFGFLHGGGKAYCELAKMLKGKTAGAKILKKSLYIIKRLISAKTRKGCKKTRSRKVVDPTAVIKSVIKNAVSVASILLTTDRMIV
ncbi:MAG: hypothetical protein LBH47_00975 [Christensenellaceae bacterium]|jgi:chaperonin GroEL|nr:hypothetical protein [Christensenellaceae bacterium]